MNKIIRYMQNYLLIGLPFVIICMLWQTFTPDINATANASTLTHFMWTALSIHFMFWFCMLILFLILMVFIPKFREKTLVRLANLQEKDEREQYITGQAARKSYISTLALTLFLLFFSLFSLKVSWGPATEAKGNHRGSVQIGMHFNLLNTSVSQLPSNVEDKVFFDSKNISLSSSALILILLLWQILGFNISAKRLSKL